jgi:predicted transcriptional regulator of viral defense system
MSGKAPSTPPVDLIWRIEIHGHSLDSRADPPGRLGARPSEPITRTELVEEFGAATASDVVKALLRKGVLQRIGRGVYLAVPLRSQGRPFAPSAATAAAALLASEPYYLGGLWAFSFHRLTEQQYGSRLDAFVTRRRRNGVVANAELVFHVLPAKEFEEGLQTAVADGANLRVSDPAQAHPSLRGSKAPATSAWV